MKPEDIIVSLNRSLAVVECRKEEFLEGVADLASSFKNHTKQLYDYLKQEEFSFNKKETEECAALRKLVIQNFDNEQIWQQLELQNKFVFEHETEKLSQLLTEIEMSELNIENEDHKSPLHNKFLESKPAEPDSQSVSSEVLPDDSLSYGSDDNGNDRIVPSRNYRISAVDDEFFKLGEMEEFLEDEDKKAEDDSTGDSSIDLFADFDDKGQNLKYKEFFDPPTIKKESKHGQKLSSKRVTFEVDKDEANEGDDEDDDDDGMQSGEEPGVDDHQMEEDDDVPKPQEFLASSSDESDEALGDNKGPLSSYERHQRSMKAIISDLEAESINPKSWQLLGETDADRRPENSLLAEDLEYDQALRPALVITEDINEKMEVLIKQRIKDQAWDDVQRKIKPIENIHEYKKRIVLDQEKSKLSLAEIYEKEYLEKQKGEIGEEKEPKEHDDIKKRLDLLFQKLDALSNYHFVPRKPEPEIKVVSNLPAMLLEDVQPVTKSDATQLAPEEILGKSRTELKGPSEVSEKDRKYSRRLKKRRQKNYFKRQKEKLASKKPNELTKVQAKKQAENFAKKNKNVKLIDEKASSKPLKSKSFFSQLQDEVTSQISSRASEVKRKKAKRSQLSANSLKL